MICCDLRDLLQLFGEEEELHSVRAEVNPVLEIAALTNRVCKSEKNNKALLFEDVHGSRFRVATNLFGSARRMALSLGIDNLSDLTCRFDEILGNLPGKSCCDKISSLIESELWRKSRAELCGENPPECLLDVAPDLDPFPLIKGSPLDGYPDHEGRFLTLPLVITADPDFTEFNCGMYRAAQAGIDGLAVSWSSKSGAAEHAAKWATAGRPMPVVIALGGPPALTFSATLPLPEEIDEFTFAGLLQGEPVKVYRCMNGLMAPAGAEIVMEGYLDTGESALSGAFGNHTGFYTPSGPASPVKVTSIRYRRDLILPATAVGKPPMEDCWLARAGGYLLLSFLKVDVPEVTNLHYPFAGIFHGGVIISVRNAAGRGVELISSIRNSRWVSGSRLLVIVDEGQDPADEAGVCWRVMNLVDWERDLIVSEGRLSVDATQKPHMTKIPVTADADTLALIESRWKEYGFADD
jgi:4-hydroxy-3-polyprenylbenzoate decarboxylase